MSVSSLKEVNALKKRVRHLRKETKLQKQAIDYDDLNSLSADDSFSSASANDSSIQDLGVSSRDDDDDEESSAGVSASLGSEEEEEDHASKKRKFDTPQPKFVAAKRPNPHFPRSVLPTDTERGTHLYSAISCNIQELERMNTLVLENLKKVEEATARLQEKENARVEESLFVLDHDKRKKDLDVRATRLDKREADVHQLEEQLRLRVVDTDKREAELKLAVDAAHQLEEQLVTRATEIERQEKLATKAKPVVAPLESFLAEMHKSNQNMLSREDMCAIVPSNLLCNLAYLAGRHHFKYHSVSNSQFLILEVTNAESGHLVMRQIVSKQLYNGK